MTDVTRKKIIVPIGAEIDSCWDGNTLDELILAIEKIRELYGSKYSNIHLDVDYSRGYGGDLEVTYRFVGEREETDKEYFDRVKKEENAKAVINKRDLEEFNRLKAKFGSM